MRAALFSAQHPDRVEKMKFTVVSHACIYVEDKGKSILIDPWLIGSSYWRSWWNFPEPDKALVDRLDPDYIYITHLHWDHFQGPSLRLFPRDTKVLVPKMPTTRMVRDLNSLRFHNVDEIGHGQAMELWEGFTLTAYQFGPAFTDSAIILSDGKTTIFDANDCKLFGLPLRQITKNHPSIDFTLRSHSSANPLPYCIEGYEEKFPEVRTKQSYAEEFTNFCLHVGSRYAIPHASNHCFLHRETVHFNDTATDPALVCDHYNNKAGGLGLESSCVVMAPGSSWDDTTGFDLSEFDYTKKEEYVAKLQDKYREKMLKQYEREESAKGNFAAFSNYFTRMINAIPGVMRKTLFPKIVFKVIENNEQHYWLLDFPTADVRELDGPHPADFMIEIPALVINDCCRKHMFSTWTPSKRLKIITENTSLFKLKLFFELLDLYENEGFPLRNNFSKRQLGVRLTRWREYVEFVVVVFKYKILRREFVIGDLFPVTVKNAR